MAAASPQRSCRACAAQDPVLQGGAGQPDGHQGAPQHALHQVSPRGAKTFFCPPRAAPLPPGAALAPYKRTAFRTPRAVREILHPARPFTPPPRETRRPAASRAAPPPHTAPHRPRRSLKAKNAELTIAKEAEDKVRVVMDEVRGREDAKKPDLPKLFKERDELRRSINEHRDAIRKIQNEFNAERKEYFEYQKVGASPACRPDQSHPLALPARARSTRTGLPCWARAAEPSSRDALLPPHCSPPHAPRRSSASRRTRSTTSARRSSRRTCLATPVPPLCHACATPVPRLCHRDGRARSQRQPRPLRPRDHR